MPLVLCAAPSQNKRKALTIVKVRPNIAAGVLIISALLTSAAATEEETQPSTANLLPNASFENETSDGMEGWTSRAWHGSEDARWSVVSPGRTGEHCTTIASENGADAAWTTTVTVQPNAWYRLSGWIKTKDVRGAEGALLNIQNMQTVRTAAVTNNQDWTWVSTVFQAEATELEINCLFGGWGSSTGQAWYDDVVLELADKADIPLSETEAVVTVDTDARSTPYSRDDLRRVPRALWPPDLRRRF